MITFDYREKDLIRAWKDPKRVETLPLGDIRIGNLLIERKTGADLAASIKDGRWREQKARLLESSYVPLYIVEGSLHEHSIPYKSLRGALLNTILRDNIHVIETSTLAFTVHVLKMIHQKIKHPPSATLLQPPRTKRKRNEDNTYIRMLMCISGVSESLARALAERYTLKQLRRVLKKSPSDVEDMPHTKKRRVGPALVKRLATYLR